MTLIEVLRRAAGYLETHGSESPRLDAEVLLAHVLGIDGYTKLRKDAWLLEWQTAASDVTGFDAAAIMAAPFDRG